MNRFQKSKNPAFIFDLGGVLLDWNPRYLFRKLFAGDEDRVNFFLNEICTQEWNMRQDAGYPLAQAIEERCRLYPEYSQAIHAYYERYQETVSGEISGTVQILAELRAAQYALCALSNWSWETFSLIRGDHAFLEWFDELVISGREGIIKPDAAIFALAARRVGRAPQDCLFIDDYQLNISAAEQLGMQAVLFTSPETLREELVSRGLIG